MPIVEEKMLPTPPINDKMKKGSAKAIKSFRSIQEAVVNKVHVGGNQIIEE